MDSGGAGRERDGGCAAVRDVATLAGPAPYRDSWSFAGNGNREEWKHRTGEGVTTTTYAYDPARPHQVTGVSVDSPVSTTTESFTYDSAGNTTARQTVIDGEASTSTGLTTLQEADQTLTFDREGELTGTDTTTTVSEYPEAGGTPTQTGQEAATTQNIYSADGDRLVRITRVDNGSGELVTGVTAYLDGGQELTMDAAGEVSATRYYSFAGQMVAVRTGKGMKNVSTLVTDHHGTPLASVPNTDWATEKVVRHHTTPYGTARSTDQLPGDHRFLGKTRDASTGYTLVGARWYDETLGRFLSVDPIMVLADPQQWHGYAYANNSPVTISDPSGLNGIRDPSPLPPLPSKPPAQEVPVSPVVPAGPSQGTGGVVAVPVITSQSQIPPGGFAPGTLIEDSYRQALLSNHPDPWVFETNPIKIPPCGSPERAAFTGFSACDTQAGEILYAIFVEDYVDCAHGDAGACGWAVVGFIPVGKAAKVLKVGDEILDGARDTARAACSFAGSTLVLMADGTRKPIEDVEVGDEVIATDPETGEQAAKKVTHVWVHRDELFEFEVSGELIVTTEDHPFWSVTGQAWEKSQDLATGELVLTADRRALTVTQGINRDTRQTGMAYNLAVDGIHTYHVGERDVLVHNRCIHASVAYKDWANKGAHVHIGKHEVRIFPNGSGGVGAEPIRLRNGTASDREVQEVLDAISSDPALRKDIIAKATSARDAMNAGDYGTQVNRAAEIHFLIKALEKME